MTFIFNTAALNAVRSHFKTRRYDSTACVGRPVPMAAKTAACHITIITTIISYRVKSSRHTPFSPVLVTSLHTQTKHHLMLKIESINRASRKWSVACEGFGICSSRFLVILQYKAQYSFTDKCYGCRTLPNLLKDTGPYISLHVDPGWAIKQKSQSVQSHVHPKIQIRTI